MQISIRKEEENITWAAQSTYSHTVVNVERNQVDRLGRREKFLGVFILERFHTTIMLE